MKVVILEKLEFQSTSDDISGSAVTRNSTFKYHI